MQTATFFNIANTAALLAWLFLLFLPKWKFTIPYIISFIIFFLAASYTFIIAKALPGIKLDAFNSLGSIRKLFETDTALLAGWIHYLAFDLFVGVYIVREAEKYKINRVLLSILLLLTFLFGPLGYFMFQIIKLIKGWKKQKIS